MPTMYIFQTKQPASNRVEVLSVKTLPHVYASWRKQRGMTFVSAFRELTYSITVEIAFFYYENMDKNCSTAPT